MRNRSTWLEGITAEASPRWPCAECGTSVLRLDVDSFVYRETEESKRHHGHADWDPEWIEYVFTAWLECADTSCGSRVAASGKGGVEMEFSGRAGPQFVEVFRPQSLAPMPDMIALPRECPKGVRRPLRRSFRAFFADPAASANHIRSAVEHLLDEVGVPREDSAGKRQNLHQRLQEFRATEKVIGDRLLAVKWLGNTGSHGSIVSRHDLLDAMEIFEDALTEVVERRQKKLTELAERLRAKHDPSER